MNNKIFFILVRVLFFLSILLLAACSSTVEGRSTIPIYTGLIADSGKYDQDVQKMVNIEKTALPDKQIEINAYTTSAKESDVQQFYDDNLKGWKDLGGSDTNGITIVRWGTGSTKGFALYYSTGTNGSQNVVLLEQFWK
jgi:hypothetical protein